jgi:hypothetical protein
LGTTLLAYLNFLLIYINCTYQWVLCVSGYLTEPH